jgi:hypothetical protein
MVPNEAITHPASSVALTVRELARSSVRDVECARSGCSRAWTPNDRICRAELRRFAPEVINHIVGCCRLASRFESAAGRFDDERWLAALACVDLDFNSAVAQPVHVVIVSSPRADQAFHVKVWHECTDIVEHIIQEAAGSVVCSPCSAASHLLITAPPARGKLLLERQKTSGSAAECAVVRLRSGHEHAEACTR